MTFVGRLGGEYISRMVDLQDSSNQLHKYYYNMLFFSFRNIKARLGCNCNLKPLRIISKKSLHRKKC